MPHPTAEQFMAFWDMVDVNKDGKLDIFEFKKACANYKKDGKSAVLTDREIVKLFQGANQDNDKFLTQQEFKDYVYKKEKNCQNLTAAFKSFDKDGDGNITAAELRTMMLANGYTEDDVKVCFEGADKDGDGKIDFNEFMNAMYAD